MFLKFICKVLENSEFKYICYDGGVRSNFSRGRWKVVIFFGS